MPQNAYLRAKIEERAAKSAVLQSLQNRAAVENRDLTEAESTTFDEVVKRLGALDSDIERISAFDQAAAKYVGLVGAQAQAAESAELRYADHASAGRDRDRQIETRQAIDFGAQFVESTAFRNYRGAGTSDRVTLPGPASPEFRAAITLDSLVDQDGQPIYRPQVWEGPAGPRFVNTFLGLIGRVATNQNAIMYIKWAPNPPGDAKVVKEGELKPEADMNPISATAMLYTVAHYKAITRQALEDHPQVRSIIQNRLLAGVASKLEHDAVAALTGDTTIATVSERDLQRAIRVGIATAESNGYSPNAVLVNPIDAASLDLAAMGVSFSGPVRSGTAWGLPIITAMSVPAGTSYVGDFRQGVTWFDRGTTDVYLSDSHADFFLRNQLVILAEARAAFEVTEAGAIIKVAADPIELPAPGNGGGGTGGQTTAAPASPASTAR